MTEERVTKLFSKIAALSADKRRMVRTRASTIVKEMVLDKEVREHQALDALYVVRRLVAEQGRDELLRHVTGAMVVHGYADSDLVDAHPRVQHATVRCRAEYRRANDDYIARVAVFALLRDIVCAMDTVVKNYAARQIPGSPIFNK